MQPNSTQFLDQLLSSSVTACFTVLGGVIVLALGQIAVKFFIEPLHEYTKLLGEIAHSLTFYGNVYGKDGIVPKEKTDEASETLRRQASQLRATAWTLRWYGLWRFFDLVPSKENVTKASTNLIGLSNSMHREDDSTKRREEIRELLHLN